MPNWKIEHVTQREKVPVTVVTGFLGSGKTTLLNYLLQNRGEANIAVVENEFGEVNIDRELVVENVVEKENVVTMSNGCVCCSLRKDIVKAFAVVERQSRVKRIDSVILETTGLADPAPVAFTFFANPWIASRFRLDSIICLVDCKHLMQHLEDAQHTPDTVNEAVQQIAFADVILLNKVDLVQRDEVASVMQSIRHINQTAKVLETVLTDPLRRPPLAEVLLTGLFSVNRALEVDPHFLDSEDPGAESEEEEAPQTEEATTTEVVAELLPPASADSIALRATPCASSPTASSSPQQHVNEPAAASVQLHTQAPGTDMELVPLGPSARGAVVEADMGEVLERRTSRPSSKHRLDLDTCQLQQPGEARGEDGPQARRSSHGTASGMPRSNSRIVRRPKVTPKKMHDLSDVSSVGIFAKGDLDEYRFNMFMRDLLAEKSKDIFRCKGFLSIHGYNNMRFIFQGVHETICYGPAERPFAEDEDRCNSIVFIGRAMDRKALSEGFRSCVWTPLPEGWEEFKDPSLKRSYYVNRSTGEKIWTRPEHPALHVVATQATTQQLRRAKVARLDSASLLAQAPCVPQQHAQAAHG